MAATATASAYDSCEASFRAQRRIVDADAHEEDVEERWEETRRRSEAQEAVVSQRHQREREIVSLPDAVLEAGHSGLASLSLSHRHTRGAIRRGRNENQQQRPLRGKKKKDRISRVRVTSTPEELVGVQLKEERRSAQRTHDLCKSKKNKKKSANYLVGNRRGPLWNLASPFASLLTRALHRGPCGNRSSNSVNVTEMTQPAALDQEPNGPGNAGSSGETGILWFRNDLRLHDHEALSLAMKQCSTILPVFCFDPREYGRAQGQGSRDKVYFDRAGPYKAGFTQEAVRALRRKLRSLGSDLLIRLGKPEEVIPQLCKLTKATVVYCHGEVSKRDQVVEDTLERSLKTNNGNGSGSLPTQQQKLKRCWGSSTLHHVRDVPFEFDSMPANYSAFCKQLNQTEIKPLVSAPKKLRPWPVHGRKLKRGKIPSLEQLGIHVPKQKDVFLKTRDGKRAKGGEDMALSYLRRHSSSLRGRGCPEDVRHSLAQRLPDQLAPWFSLGCISVKKVFHEVLGTQNAQIQGKVGPASSVSNKSSSISAISKKEEKDFIFELLWRDFFRFSRLKMSKTRKNRYGNIATATV